MSRRIVFNEIEKIHKTTGLSEIKDVLLMIYNLLSLNQFNPGIRLKHLKFKSKYEIFIDERTKESQLADLEDCFSKCAENQIIEAVFRLDNFIAPFNYMIDEPFSDFEKVCMKLMIEHILAKIEEGKFMGKLLPCPECGGQPTLSSLESEYQSMKYFCGAHVACGDWKKTVELAVEDWNRRVKEYKNILQRTETPSTPEFLEKQGRMSARAYCEVCDYETEIMPMKDLVFRLSMEGGYIISDKNGGYSSQCPKCGSINLSLETD